MSDKLAKISAKIKEKNSGIAWLDWMYAIGTALLVLSGRIWSDYGIWFGLAANLGALAWMGAWKSLDHRKKMRILEAMSFELDDVIESLQRLKEGRIPQ